MRLDTRKVPEGFPPKTRTGVETTILIHIYYGI